MKIRIITAAIISLAMIGVLQSAGRAQQTATRSVWDGVYTEEQAQRGAALFASNCASCHGNEAAGGEMAPELAGPSFLANWSGLTVGDLSERIRITMPPNNPGGVSRQQNVDIISHLLRANNFPAGKTELVTQTEQLKQIKIESQKP